MPGTFFGTVNMTYMLSTQFATASESDSALQRVPLTSDEIAALYPNLPAADQLWNAKSCLFIDLNNYGKIDSLNPANIDLSIMNYTSDVMDYHTGRVIRKVPHIWLRYNETIWVQVPLAHLINRSSESGPTFSTHA